MLPTLPPAARRLLLACALPVLALGVVACGEKPKDETPVARVGDRDITLAYFEYKMNSMDPAQLPPDIESRGGRAELLETMIDKEVMVLKAEQLGYDADGEADEAAEKLAELMAVKRMRDEVTAHAEDVSEDEILDYYEDFARRLEISYMLLDHQEEAIEAKRLVEGGEPWQRVADRLGVGPAGPSGDYRMVVKYGQLADDLESVIFELPVGAVSDPVPTIYGLFVIRVDGQTIERVPPLESMRDQVIASVRKQKTDLAIADHIRKVQAEYGFATSRAALDTLYGYLPEDVPLGPPVPADELEPLRLPPRVLDMELMRYADETWTLRRYQDLYNGMSSLARPRRERLVGGLRRGLEEIALRELMPQAARDRGFMEDPQVEAERRMRREQHMVTRLHQEVIVSEVEVAPEEARAYFEEHREDQFYRPEQRKVMVLVAPDEASALAAMVDARGGVEWTELVERYGSDGTQPSAEGGLAAFQQGDENPFAELAFSVASVDDVSEPRQVGEQEWALVKLVELDPEYSPAFEEVAARAGQRVQAIKADELFQEKVGQWREEFTVETWPERLDRAVYDPSSISSLPTTKVQVTP